MSLWTEKYRPQTIEDMVGNSVSIKKAQAWLSNFKDGIPNTKRALFIVGPPGIGKTTFANILLRSFEYDIVEFNASDIRNQKLVKEKFKSILGKVSISSLMGGSKFLGVIMDEVDGMSSGDKGGVAELISLINPNKGKRKKDKKVLPYQNPIICICNDEKDKKLQDLKKESEYIRFFPPKLTEIYQYAEKILKLEKLKIDDDDLLDTVKFCQQDIRKLIGNLEYLTTRSNKKKKIKLNSEGLDKKQEEFQLFESVFHILDKYQGIEKTLQVCNSDRSLINLLVHENILNMMSNYKNTEKKKLKVMENIYYSMSESDLLDSYLYNNFNHDLCEVNGLLRCGATSLFLNEQKRNAIPTFQKNDIIFSKLLSKFSIQHQNYKAGMVLHNKLCLTNHYRDNYDLYHIIIKKLILSYNNKVLDPEILYLIKKHSLEMEDFEKIYKLIKIKVCRTVREKDLSTLAQTDIDKKYLTKIWKQFQLT